MFMSIVRLVRLPWLLLLIWAIARFTLGLAGVPYAPRGNAVFSIVGLTFISCIYFGALSKKVAGWDALNVPEGTVVPMSSAMASRAGGLLFGGIIVPALIALIGRALSGLFPVSVAKGEAQRRS
jgi:hypothetical protein